MICLTIILVVLGVLLMLVSLGAAVLLDPIICIFAIMGIVGLIKKFSTKKK